MFAVSTYFWRHNNKCHYLDATVQQPCHHGQQKTCNLIIIHHYGVITNGCTHAGILSVVHFHRSTSHYHHCINTAVVLHHHHGAVPPSPRTVWFNSLYVIATLDATTPSAEESAVRTEGIPPNSVWETGVWTQRLPPQSAFDANRCRHRVSATSEVSTSTFPSCCGVRTGRPGWLFTATCLSGDYTSRIHECASFQRVRESSEMTASLLKCSELFIHYRGLQHTLKSALYN